MNKKVSIFNRIMAYFIDLIIIFAVSFVILFLFGCFVGEDIFYRDRVIIFKIFIFLYPIYNFSFMISNGNTIGEKINKFQFDYIKKSNRVFKNICRSILKIVFILTGLLLVDLLFLLINKDNRSLIDIIVGEYAVYEDEIKNTTKNEITKEEKINILKKRAKILIIFGIIFILLSIVVISFFYYISFVDVSSKSDGDAQLFSFLFGLFITMIFATIGILLSIFGLTTIRDYKLLEAKKE